MRKLYEFLVESLSKYNTKEEILDYLEKIKAYDILNYIYDQTKSPTPPDNFKFIFKKSETAKNQLCPIESKITHNEFVAIAEKYGLKIVNYKFGKDYELTDGNIRIKCHESGWSASKGDTNNLTTLKEQAALLAIQYKLFTDKDFDKLNELFCEWSNTNFQTTFEENISHIQEYVNSGLKSANVFYSYDKFKDINPNNYIFERRDENVKKIYNKAKEICGAKPDNWNPADVWMIHKDFDLNSFVKEFDNSIDIKIFNGRIKQEMENLNLIPLSLKLITNNSIGEITEMNPVSIESLENNIRINTIQFGITRGTNVIGSMKIILDNGYVLNVWDKSNLFSTTWELRTSRTTGHAEGCTDKDIIKKYVYGNENVSRKLKSLIASRNEKEFASYLKDIFIYCKRHNIELTVTDSKKNITLSEDYILNTFCETEDIKTLGRLIMIILNLYYLTKNLSSETINMLYLAGLKTASYQCAYWKIH